VVAISQPKRVFYTPTATNVAMVAKLRELSRFKDVMFVALPEDERERWKAIGVISGRAMMIWGDGKSHHDSYFFTLKRTGILLKANIDWHRDSEMPGPGKSRFSRGLTTFGCANHMTVTEDDGVEIMVRPWDSYAAFLDRIEARIRQQRHGNSAITIDWDVVPAFPAYPNWVYGDGIESDKIIQLIRNVAGIERFIRLDMGGVVLGVLNFDLIPKQELRMPSYGEVETISGIYQYPSQLCRVATEMRDRVMSKAFWIYADTIGAFFGLES